MEKNNDHCKTRQDFYYNIIFLFYIDPSSVYSNVTNLTVNETDRIHLTCYASGVPQPVMTWYHRNELLRSNNFLTLTNIQTELIIINSNRERDEGTYTCQARNNVTNLINATDSHNITVYIQGISYFHNFCY